MSNYEVDHMDDGQRRCCMWHRIFLQKLSSFSKHIMIGFLLTTKTSVFGTLNLPNPSNCSSSQSHQIYDPPSTWGNINQSNTIHLLVVVMGPLTLSFHFLVHACLKRQVKKQSKVSQRKRLGERKNQEQKQKCL